MTLRALSWLSILLVTGCVTRSAAQPRESVVPTPPRQSPLRPHDPAAGSFRENLARAQSEAESAGWVVQEVIEIPKRHAALVLYQPKPERAPATKLTRVDAVGAGGFRVMSAESGLIDVMKAPGGDLLWNLRGDGSNDVVLHLTPCGANCGVAKPLVLELTEQGFRAPPAAPECPTCKRDENRDGVPEFELRDVYDFWYEIDKPLELNDEITDTVFILQKRCCPAARSPGRGAFQSSISS